MQTQIFSTEKRECLRLQCSELEDVGKCMHGLFNFSACKLAKYTFSLSIETSLYWACSNMFQFVSCSQFIFFFALLKSCFKIMLLLTGLISWIWPLAYWNVFQTAMRSKSYQKITIFYLNLLDSFYLFHIVALINFILSLIKM